MAHWSKQDQRNTPEPIRYRGWVVAIGLLALAAGLAFPSALSAQKETTQEADWLSGRVSARVIHRQYTPDDATFYEKATDQDLYLQLQLDSRLSNDGRYQFHFNGLTKTDLDGNQDQTGYYPLESSADAGADATRYFLFKSHFDINHLLPVLPSIRLGRQAGTRDEMITFDGLALDMEPTRTTRVALYGGKPVHFFEFGAEAQQDSLQGLGVDLFTRSSTRLSLDYLKIRDIFEPGDERRDDLLALKLTQRFGRWWRAMLRTRRINGESRDLKVRAVGTIPSWELMLQLVYFRQYRIQEEVGMDLSPFIELLGQSYPYTVMEAKVLWRFAGDYGLSLGHYQRRLDEAPPSDTADIAFNREFTRNFLVFDVDHLIADGLSLALTGESWKTGDRDLTSHGFDLGYRYGKGREKGRFNLGSYYSLYRYDYYITLGERTQVRTNYFRGKHPFGTDFSVDWKLEVENGLGTWLTAKAGVRYEF